MTVQPTAAAELETAGYVTDWDRADHAKPRLTRKLYNWVGAAGALILLILALLSVAPGAFAPYDPTEMVAQPFQTPSSQHPLGTNDIGQDILSELIYGTRASLVTGLVVALAAVLMGTVAGLLTGYYSNTLSEGVLIVVDLVLVIPFLPLAMLLSAYLGPGQRNVILLLIVVSWAIPARLIRSRVLSVSEAPYVEASRALGSSDRLILQRHIWPAVRILVLVQFVMVAAASILAEASLSFLGLGDPATKSWGTMLFFAKANGVFLGEAWKWWVVPAGVMISLSVLGLVLLAYAVERRLEPNLK